MWKIYEELWKGSLSVNQDFFGNNFQGSGRWWSLTESQSQSESALDWWEANPELKTWPNSSSQRIRPKNLSINFFTLWTLRARASSVKRGERARKSGFRKVLVPNRVEALVSCKVSLHNSWKKLTNSEERPFQESSLKLRISRDFHGPSDWNCIETRSRGCPWRKDSPEDWSGSQLSCGTCENGRCLHRRLQSLPRRATGPRLWCVPRPGQPSVHDWCPISVRLWLAGRSRFQAGGDG